MSQDHDPEFFIGIWGERDEFGFFRPRVEIDYAPFDGTYYFQPFNNVENDEMVIETKETANGIIYVTEKTYDYGFRGTLEFESRSRRADAGYSRSGRFGFDKLVYHHTYTIEIKGDNVICEHKSVHYEYFLRGEIVYAETDSHLSEGTIKLEKKKTY